VWEETNLSYPSGWIMTICDNAACYNVPHARDTMLAVTAGDSGFLKVTVIPQEILGTGTVSYHVYDLNSPTSQADVTFNFNVLTGTVDVQYGNLFAVSPSPATAVLNLRALRGQLDRGTVQLYSLDGRVVLSTDVATASSAQIDVADLESGIYLLRYTSKAGSMTKKVVVAH
jgi:hypothetical protein